MQIIVIIAKLSDQLTRPTSQYNHKFLYYVMYGTDTDMSHH